MDEQGKLNPDKAPDHFVEGAWQCPDCGTRFSLSGTPWLRFACGCGATVDMQPAPDREDR